MPTPSPSEIIVKMMIIGFISRLLVHCRVLGSTDVTVVCTLPPRAGKVNPALREPDSASRLRAAHLAGAGAGGFGFGTTMAPPSCLSSTLRLKLVAAAGLGEPAMSFSAPFIAC